MTGVLKRHWFLFSLLVLIPGGVTAGLAVGDGIARYTHAIEPRLVTAVALFLMAFTLDSTQLRRSLARPWPVLLATGINFGLIPAMALFLIPWQLAADFRIGLMIAASVPCTMAAASVWTRHAGGNDAVSLLVTLVTNSLCVVVTPFWMWMGTGEDVDLEVSAMAARLLTAVLLPGVLGQLLRLIPAARLFAIRNKRRISVFAMCCILVLVLASAGECGVQLGRGGDTPGILAVAVVWACCVGLHLVAMTIALLIARLTGISVFDRRAVAFASSQKTLPIGVLLSRELATVASVPFAVFPMLMFHASQLVIDTAIANRMQAGGVPEGGGSDPTDAAVSGDSRDE